MDPWAPSAYGDGMADVYDDWYGDLDDLDDVVGALARLAAGGPVLELGVGTGRIALPLAARGLAVHGIDASAAMLERLRAKDPDGRVTTVIGDMTGPLPAGPWALVVVAFNTLFNLPSAEAQSACLAACARVLADGGVLVVDAVVPSTDAAAGPPVDLVRVTPERVVLRAQRVDLDAQRVQGALVDLGERGVRVRPYDLRWSSVEELDAMASAAGLTLRERHAGWRGEPFDVSSARHVSIWARGQR